MSTQPLNIISRYGEDDISLWTVNVEFEDYKRVAGNAVQLKVEFQDICIEDHPRTRGEKLSGMTKSIPSPGSPPHTRGKAVNNRRRQSDHKDHPRTRGEKALPWIMTVMTLGSPPHTRGKVGKGTEMIGDDRITPAHAGKSLYYGLRFLSRPQTRRQELLPTAPRRAGF